MAPTSWADATAVKPKNSHTYEIDLQDDWCIGSVPHGGYVTSCFLRVAAAHFAGTLQEQNQPHSMTLHMEFPRRTEIGPAEFRIKDIKLGRQTSTIHISLLQHGKEDVLAYINQTNLRTQQGVTFPTHWQLDPSPAPVDLPALRSGADTRWVEQDHMPFREFRKASNQVRFFFPRQGQPLRSIADQWLAFRDGSRFTTESLGFVADMFPQVVESYRDEDDPYHVPTEPAKRKKPIAARFWYPTVVLNLDIKKALPDEGVEWLFCRTRSKEISRGRLDIEVVIMDENGELIALSHHVTLVLSAARNLAARKRGDSQSKI